MFFGDNAFFSFNEFDNNDNRKNSNTFTPICFAIYSPQDFIEKNPELFPEIPREKAYGENLYKQEILDQFAIYRFKQFNLFIEFLNLHKFGTLTSYTYLRFFYAHVVFFYGVNLNSASSIILRTGLNPESYLYTNFFNPVKYSPLLFDTDNLSDELIYMEEIYFLLVYRATNITAFDFFFIYNFFTIYDKNTILENHSEFATSLIHKFREIFF